MMSAPTWAQDPDKTILADPLGQNRLLVVCLPNDREISRDEKTFIYQTDWEGFAERDLLLVGLNKQTAFNFLAQDPRNDPHAAGIKSHYIYRNPVAGKDIRERVDCAHDFQMILIGKDTGVKARWNTDFTQEDLFSRIDAMPMRRFEIRERQRNDR